MKVSRTCAVPRRCVVPLGMMAVIGMLAYEFQVVLPVVARSTFHGGAQAYGFLTAAMGIGAVIGGLGVASRSFTGTRALVGSAAIFGGVILLAAAAPNLVLACVAMALVGAGSVGFLAIGNATLQLCRVADDAWPRDGAVGRGLPRFHPDRRTDRRLRQPALRRPGRADPRRGLLSGGGRRAVGTRCAGRPPGPAASTDADLRDAEQAPVAA